MDDSAIQKRSNKLKSRQSIAHIPSARDAAYKDNATTDVSALQAQHANQQLATKKKSRGKSLGPGGIEALKESSANATKSPAPFQIKSILKPAIPLTPPKAIPTFDELRKRSTGKGRSPSKNYAEDLLIDFSTPGPNRHDGGNVSTSSAGTGDALDPFSPIAQHTPGKEQQNPDQDHQDHQDQLKRQQEKRAILERRAARRKSLANRRVSFAPEATLHTWSVMEMAEDSTTSSASNSTRRQSSMTAEQSPVKSISASATPLDPSTPSELTEEVVVKESPAHQRDLHQKKRRRRSSGLAEPMLDASQDDVFSSSPSGDVATNSSPIRVEEGIESSDESDTDGDTAMSMDDATVNTVASQESGSSTQSSLEHRLRQAAQQAGTRGIDYDENGEDMSMEMATGTVTHAFQPWARGNDDNQDHTAMYDQENVNQFENVPRLRFGDKPHASEFDVQDLDQTEEMSMDVTRAMGGILASQSPTKTTSKSPTTRRRSSIHRRRSSDADSMSDETMEFTVMQGGIVNNEIDYATKSFTEVPTADEGMTMEFTKAVGAILSGSNRRDSDFSNYSDVNDANDTMDMTAAVGVILPPIEEQTEPQSDIDGEYTMAMDMTRAVGGIINQTPITKPKSARKSLGTGSATTGDYAAPSQPNTDARERIDNTTIPNDLHVASVASETGSPRLALKTRQATKSPRNAPIVSTTPASRPKGATPTKATIPSLEGTPSRQITPLPARAETPNKTPLSVNVAQRGASPKKLFKAEIKARASPASAKREAHLKANALFSRDAETGQQTPSVVLRATRPNLARRRSSGIGVDKDGIGSPRVSELLDRRGSLSEAVPQFKLGNVESLRLRFEDPQQIQNEVENERVEEHRRESGRFIMEQEADEQQNENATLQLKDMIESLSPKKSKPTRLKGRKSLAIGGAKGLLGKRPAELDLDEEEDAESTPKRLKTVSREGSPVKKIHLPKPPSKDETTGKLTTKLQKALQEMANTEYVTPKIGPVSPAGSNAARSPATTGRFRDAEVFSGARPTSFEDKLDNVVGAIDVSTAQMLDSSNHTEEEKISLQDFLNMTNIHFIELSTTKRRHTIARKPSLRDSDDGSGNTTLEDSFVAAATTLPLLELYQHATRELKTYISTGRKIVRSIEAETLAEQPPLFREYVDARPDVKLVMDNQFRNGKASARLQSKEGWYQWRTQLVEGLKSGLEGINTNMRDDLEVLVHQQEALDRVVPVLLKQQSELRKEMDSLRQTREELDSVDHEALDRVRQSLQSADEYHLQRSALLDSLRDQMEQKEDAVSAANEMKVEILDQITEADRVREEHKGWPASDVIALKTKAEDIERVSGWRLLTAEEDTEDPDPSGAALTMMYKDQLRLFFYPQAFQQKVPNNRRRSGRNSASVSGPTAPISLTFSPIMDDDDDHPAPVLPTEKRFFLQLIRSQLHAFSMMPKGSVSPKSLLSTVSQGWDLACRVSQELHFLNMAGITTASILGDEKLSLKVMMIMPTAGRIDLEFVVTVTVLTDGDIVAATTVNASAVYGGALDLLSGSRSRKVQQALGKEIETRHLGDGAWIKAVHGFEAWFVVQEEKSKQANKKNAELATPAPISDAVPKLSPSKPSTSATPAPKRSPLATKRTNVIQKKALPVPKQRLDKSNFNPSHSLNSQSQTLSDKENFNPSVSTNKSATLSIKTNDEDPTSWDQKPFTVPKAAIPPEMQEAMMLHTPIKRVGALRRSPI